MNVWPIISTAIAAISWAAASVLIFRYGHSVFVHPDKIETQRHQNFWNPVFSSKHAKQIFGFKVDAFHLLQSFAILLLCTPAAKQLDWHPTGLKFWKIDVDFLICLAIIGSVWNICFPNAYGKLWTRKQPKETNSTNPN